jgi:hypothetical protein
MRRQPDGDYDATVTGRRRRTAVAGGSVGAKTKSTMTEAAVEATAIAGRVDTLAATTVTTATMRRRQCQRNGGGGAVTAEAAVSAAVAVVALAWQRIGGGNAALAVAARR